MDPRHSSIRTRWAALGAAVAITLGAGGISVVGATIDSGERTSFVAMTPCRLADSRPASNVGPRDTPIGEQEELVVAAHGTNGNCTITDQATGLVLNITAVDPTAPTNLRVFPADDPLPTTSNLNPVPGAPPAPNAVTTGLDASGQFKIFNAFGNVDVIADVVGYYEDHNHDDRYPLKEDVYTKAQVDSRTAPDHSQTLLGGDFEPAKDLTFDFDRFRGFFRFIATDKACAHAPIRLEPGASIGHVAVTFLASTPDAKMNIQIEGRSILTGSSPSQPNERHNVVDQGSGAQTSGSVRTYTLPFPRTTLSRDYVYSLQICTVDTIEIRRAVVGLPLLTPVAALPIDPAIGD